MTIEMIMTEPAALVGKTYKLKESMCLAGNKRLYAGEKFKIMEYCDEEDGNLYVGDLPASGNHWRVVPLNILKVAVAEGMPTDNIGFYLDEADMIKVLGNII